MSPTRSKSWSASERRPHLLVFTISLASFKHALYDGRQASIDGLCLIEGRLGDVGVDSLG